MDGSADFNMMTGSTGGADYLMFARRGNVGLGLKVLGVQNGSNHNMPGKVYLHFRVRSAEVSGMQQHESDTSVVSLSEHKLSHDDAWPGITFDKVNDTRASTVVGVFIRGELNLEHGEETVQRVRTGGYLEKVIDFLIEAAGPENMVVKPEMMRDWARERLNKGLDSFETFLKERKKLEEAQQAFLAQGGANLDTVGFHAAQMKMIYDALHSDQGEDKSGDASGEESDTDQ
jgi:hypothetical protein